MVARPLAGADTASVGLIPQISYWATSALLADGSFTLPDVLIVLAGGAGHDRVPFHPRLLSPRLHHDLRVSASPIRPRDALHRFDPVLYHAPAGLRRSFVRGRHGNGPHFRLVRLTYRRGWRQRGDRHE